MRSSIFKNVLKIEYDYTHDEKYILYLINKAISECEEKKCTINYITEYFEKIYGNTFKISNLKEIVNDNFEKNGVNNYVISNDKKVIINVIDVIRKKIDNLINESEEELYNKLYNNIQNNDSKFVDIFSYFSTIELLSDPNLKKEVLLCKIYNMLEERFINYENKYDMLKNIKDIYSRFSINYLVKKESCINILSMNNINTIEDLKSAKHSILDLLFIFDDCFIETCAILSKPIIDSLKDIVVEYYKIIDDKSDRILKMRYGLCDSKPKTLEEIGTEFGVTRERIRQIETKTIDKIKEFVTKKEMLLTMFFNILRKNNKIIELSDINKYIQNTDISSVISLIYILSNIDECSFNMDYCCLYDSNYSFEDLINERLNTFPIYLSEEQAKSYTDVDELIFKKNYRKYQNIYLRNDLLHRDLYLSVIKNNFPNGYRTNSEDDYNKLKDIIINKIGQLEEFPAQRSISAMISRDLNMIQCDEGTYIEIKNIDDIPDDLVQRIIDYIFENKPVVYYNSIFKKFKNDLLKYNINNQFLLKGLIDRKLPDGFFTKRDYISIGDKEVCPYDRIIEIIKSFDNFFTINNLRKEMPGVEDYVFYNVLYPEKENGLIFLDNKKFIYRDKIIINDADKDKLKTIIDELFKILNSDVITVRKVYARIKLMEKDYSINLGIKNYSYYDLFSIINVLFPNDYYYSRPFISLNPDVSSTREELLKNHLTKYNSFTNTDVKEYLTKMNAGNIYSYLMFMDSMSDNYVQVDLDKMVKKEYVGLTEENIRNIKKTIKLLINNFGEIDTRTFNGYSMFPKIKYNWNKYLLAGIVRTFLSDDYTVDYTDNTYRTTEFIIRRDSDE